jgi:hypothetical protein
MTTRKRNASIEAVVQTANRMLATSTVTREPREGIIALVESVLFASGTYRGFRYLDPHEVPDGCPPGIVWGYNDQGERDNSRNKYPDETRRAYN